jgi:hypothetical protein
MREDGNALSGLQEIPSALRQLPGLLRPVRQAVSSEGGAALRNVFM